MKKIFTVTNVILFVIALILFFGLFKREIQVWKYNNWPGYREKRIILEKTCTHSEWVRHNYYIECSFAADNLNLSGQDKTLYINKCNNDKSKSDPSKLISSSYPCNEEKNETWFYAFGKYWFKKK